MSAKVTPNILEALQLMFEWANMLPDEMLDGDPEIRLQYLDDIKTAHDAIKYLLQRGQPK